VLFWIFTSGASIWYYVDKRESFTWYAGLHSLLLMFVLALALAAMFGAMHYVTTQCDLINLSIQGYDSTLALYRAQVLDDHDSFFEDMRRGLERRAKRNSLCSPLRRWDEYVTLKHLEAVDARVRANYTFRRTGDKRRRGTKVSKAYNADALMHMILNNEIQPAAARTRSLDVGEQIITELGHGAKMRTIGEALNWGYGLLVTFYVFCLIYTTMSVLESASKGGSTDFWAITRGFALVTSALVVVQPLFAMDNLSLRWNELVQRCADAEGRRVSRILSENSNDHFLKEHHELMRVHLVWKVLGVEITRTSIYRYLVTYIGTFGGSVLGPGVAAYMRGGRKTTKLA